MYSVIRSRLTLRSIRARLTFWYLVTLGVTLAGFACAFWLIRARTLYREFDAALQIRGRDIVDVLRPALLDLDPASALAVRGAMVREPVLVRMAGGAAVYRAPGFPLVGWAAERDLAAAARDLQPVIVVLNHPVAGPLRVATIPVERQGAEALVLQIVESGAPVQASLKQLGAGMALGIAIVLAIAAYGSGRTARHALAPVDAIVARVREIQSAGLEDRLDVPGGSAELDRLVATLNDMLGRVEASMRSAKRFAADASHELQTPLTAMRGLVESRLRGANDDTIAQASDDLLLEIERSSALIRDLRLFALAEAGHLVDEQVAVDLATLAEECVEIARAIAEPRQIAVDFAVDDRPSVRGAALHLRRVLLNLTTNAITYSPTGATIELRVGREGSDAVVTVRDHGCGIGAEDLPHVFEPFYRADPARARETGGTGLGLAIADQIVRAHGGQIVVSSEPGAGSTFTVTLPALGLS